MVNIGLVETVTITFDFYFGKDDELMQAFLGVLVAFSESGVDYFNIFFFFLSFD
jgi:hypothetical protein